MNDTNETFPSSIRRANHVFAKLAPVMSRVGQDTLGDQCSTIIAAVAIARSIPTQSDGGRRSDWVVVGSQTAEIPNPVIVRPRHVTVGIKMQASKAVKCKDRKSDQFQSIPINSIYYSTRYSAVPYRAQKPPVKNKATP